MLKVLFAPLYVIYAACKGCIKFAEAFEKLGAIADEAAGVGLNATTTWSKEESILNEEKIRLIRANIAKAQAEGKPYEPIHKEPTLTTELKLDKDVQPKDDIKL